jgi:hypothetical protein|tara:strand:- start:29 stop:190 length:162 start_codon:yes stop_codon:yes gene_type:complete
MSDTIASRVKKRGEKKVQKKNVDLAISVHKKLILQRKKEYEIRKKKAGEKTVC